MIRKPFKMEAQARETMVPDKNRKKIRNKPTNLSSSDIIKIQRKFIRSKIVMQIQAREAVHIQEQN